MITPSNLYRNSGRFGMVYKGTAAQLADVPGVRWTPTEGDLWFDTTNNVYKQYDGTSWVPLSSVGSAVTISDADYPIPLALHGLAGVVETFADTDNDDVELGKVNIITGSTVEGQIADIGTATVGRVTGIVNRSGATILASNVDEDNTKINLCDGRLSIVDDGWVALLEVANDKFVVLAGDGWSLVAEA